MAGDKPQPPSFSPYRKWTIGFNVVLLIVLVAAVVVMVNYLSRDFSYRFHWSARSRNPLSPRSLSFAQSLAKDVEVTLYYDRNDPLYSKIADLLREYDRASPRIRVQSIDYLRDPGAAAQLKYPFLASANAKNLVIFDCEGKTKYVEGDALAQYALEQVPNETDKEFRRKPVAFLAEQMFTAALLDVTNPKPLKACYLQGHGEHAIDSGDRNVGYLKFASFLQQNYVQLERLSLVGTNTVPMDCNLLIIAGPTIPIPEPELDRIEQYLAQGGRLFVLFSCLVGTRETGLEKVLAKWGVQVGRNIVRDPDNQHGDSDVVVTQFGQHPIVNPLLTLGLHLYSPHPVGSLRSRAQTADAPRVDELMFSGPRSALAGMPGVEPRSYSLAAAVERGAIKEITERGTTRMVVTGDSIFLGNLYIDSAANRDFLGYAVNWLLGRTQLLQGVGPRPINEYRLAMTEKQLRQARWILLAALPGVVLGIGTIVWLRRRR